MIRQLIRSIRRHFAGITQDKRSEVEKLEAAILSDMKLFIQAFEMSSTGLGRELAAANLQELCVGLRHATSERGTR